MSREMLAVLAVVIVVCFIATVLLIRFVVKIVAANPTVATALAEVFAGLGQLLKVVLPWELLKSLFGRGNPWQNGEREPDLNRDPTPIQIAPQRAEPPEQDRRTEVVEAERDPDDDGDPAEPQAA